MPAAPMTASLFQASVFPAPGNGDVVEEGAPVVNVPLVVGAGLPLEITVATVEGAGAVLSFTGVVLT